MSDIDSTIAVNIKDELNGYDAQIDSDGDLHNKSKIWDGTNEVTVTDNKLDVNATAGLPLLYSTPIHEYEGNSSTQTKISYTVPTGKILYIQRIWASHQSDASGHTISFRQGTSAFFWFRFNNDGTTTFEKTYQDNNPFAVTAGTTITAYRLSGSSNESWSAGFDGFLEDAS